jgi:hypothetical protein
METRMNAARSTLRTAEARMAVLRRSSLSSRAKHDLANALTLVISCREILTDENPEEDLIDEAEAALRRALEIAGGIEAHAA